MQIDGGGGSSSHNLPMVNVPVPNVFNRVTNQQSKWKQQVWMNDKNAISKLT